MRKHLDEQIVNYGQQVVVNLVSFKVQCWGFCSRSEPMDEQSTQRPQDSASAACTLHDSTRPHTFTSSTCT